MRRIELTSALIEQIALDVRAGNFMEPAARRHGVGHSTLHKWLAHGRDLIARADRADDSESADAEWSDRDRLCVDLVDALEKTEAEEKGLRFHDLRHSAATILLAAGVPERVVMEILGHSTLAMVKRYQHVLPGLTVAAAERMDRVMGR